MTGNAIHAFGKLILFGEHAVVYGRPALAAGVPNGIRLHAVRATPGGIRLRVKPWGLDRNERFDDTVGLALRRLGALVPGNGTGCDLELHAGIPARAGLGSSAALSVALVQGLCLARRIAVRPPDVREMAHEIEKIFHGDPSGLDDTVAVYGGFCLFCRSGVESVELRGAPVGSRITPQAFQVPIPPTRLLLAFGSRQSTTRHMVELVRRRRALERPVVDSLFDRIDTCLWSGLAALRRGDTAALGGAMLDNHRALQLLGVSNKDLDDLVRLAVAAGAAGAKLTGAGGGGAVVAAVENGGEAVLAAWRQHGCATRRLMVTGAENP